MDVPASIENVKFRFEYFYKQNRSHITSSSEMRQAADNVRRKLIEFSVNAAKGQVSDPSLGLGEDFFSQFHVLPSMPAVNFELIPLEGLLNTYRDLSRFSTLPIAEWNQFKPILDDAAVEAFKKGYRLLVAKRSRPKFRKQPGLHGLAESIFSSAAIQSVSDETVEPFMREFNMAARKDRPREPSLADIVPN